MTNDIMHLKSLFVKRRSQPIDEHRPKKLLDQVREWLRLKHCSYRPEQAYAGWNKRYIYFHEVRHPSKLALTALAWHARPPIGARRPWRGAGAPLQ